MATAMSHIRGLDGEPATEQPRRQTRSRETLHEAPDRALRAGVVVLLALIGVVHLHLWFDGYRNIPTIGPLFLVAVITAALLAIVVAVRLNAIVAFAAASFAAGTLGSNVLSLLLPNGLFHFKEVGVSYSGGLAIASEVGVVALAGVWAYGRWRRGDTQPRPLTGVPQRTTD
jgi:hypothetical protein